MNIKIIIAIIIVLIIVASIAIFLYTRKNVKRTGETSTDKDTARQEEPVPDMGVKMSGLYVIAKKGVPLVNIAVKAPEEGINLYLGALMTKNNQWGIYKNGLLEYKESGLFIGLDDDGETLILTKDKNKMVHFDVSGDMIVLKSDPDTAMHSTDLKPITLKPADECTGVCKFEVFKYE